MLEVRRLRDDEIAAAADVIARGMAENPIHVATWPNPEVRARALIITFAAGQQRPGRYALGALDEGGTLVAVAGVAPPGSCRPSPRQAALLAAQLSPLGEEAVERYRRWRSAWNEHDPPAAHWHFGPFAVLPERRSCGIGTSIMDHYCKALDSASALGYLEADRSENLAFYNRKGFIVVHESEVLGVPTWYMRREAC